MTLPQEALPVADLFSASLLSLALALWDVQVLPVPFLLLPLHPSTVCMDTATLISVTMTDTLLEGLPLTQCPLLQAPTFLHLRLHPTIPMRHLVMMVSSCLS